MNSNLEKEIKRLANLKQNQDKDITWIEKKAQLSLWKKQLNLLSRFSQEDEKKLSEKLFDNYLSNYEISSYNDCQNLGDLIYEEVLAQKLQKEIDKILTDKNTNYIPGKQIESLHEVQERIWDLKEKLGITKKEGKDDLTAFQEFEEKLKVYIPFHRNEFTTWCAKCGEALLLRRRCNKEKFETLKHPHFSGRFWLNKRGIELIKKGLWTKEQYAWVFHTSVSYVDWVLENLHKITKIDDIDQEKINKFINEKPYLEDVTIPLKISEEKKNDKK